ncbi:hypothetical protein LTR37_015665 [Vermiconidia calcicola]|uniref:Uncharacterized protein n=1 Tax=Vermiconidia calcicola TaxID=1690605 RepID=A0ACC3MPY5_9PEZI|nr:hypothetical protein LTR37_015665 [Vermiconidia calcicola]
MATAKLDRLPKELIAYIACCADASGVLSLSRTCKVVRAVCYDSLIFKNILITSQQTCWPQSYLDIEAVASRAGNDPEVWARYALADQRAWELLLRAHPQESSTQHMDMAWLPELSVVRHPYAQGPRWESPLRDPLDPRPNQLFCVVMAILASTHDLQKVSHELLRYQDRFSRRDDSTASFLWALGTIVLGVRLALKMRLNAWPYNHDAVVPHIDLPEASQIPLRPLNDRYSLPAPFSRRAVELLGRSTSSFGSWDSWYDLHSYEAFRSRSFLSDGSWCGYYTHFYLSTAGLDPPMMEIKFKVSSRAVGNQAPVAIEDVDLLALDCVDGLGHFDIHGVMSYRNRALEFQGRKQYTAGGQVGGWDWDCRLTPFGLVGYWGSVLSTNGQLSRRGIVWLWKKEWTDASP